jgi:RNA polymerase sigma factor (TIGR02999 family)
MTTLQSADVTGLLNAWRGGDAAALDRLTPTIYAELLRLARRSSRNQPAGNSLQPTALVNEAYLRLVDVKVANWQDRVHFFAVSAQIMRWILVDRARARATSRRGGGFQREAHSSPVDLDELAGPRRGAEIIAVDDALKALSKIDVRRRGWWSCVSSGD